VKVAEASDDRLVLADTQLDKRLGIGLLVAVFLGVAVQFAWGRDWIEAAAFVALAAGALVWLKRTLIRGVWTFDRPGGRVSLVVEGRKGCESWDWALADIAGAEVSEVGRQGQTRGHGQKRPVILLTDGTRVPMRPYHSAGSQSWEAVIAVRKFLGHDSPDLPVGWIPDD